MRHPDQRVPFLCYVITFLILYGCGTQTRLYQFSPNAEVSTHRDRKDHLLLGEARLISMKPPGKPFDEIVTLSPARNIWITSIKSSDGTVLYQRPAYNSFTARMAGRLSIGVHPGTICQLPAGTYTIGAQYFAVSASKSSYSMADQYITADFQNGRKYILSYKIIEREKWSESDKWKLKLLEE